MGKEFEIGRDLLVTKPIQNLKRNADMEGFGSKILLRV